MIKAKNLPGKFSIDHLRMRGLLGSPATIQNRLRDIEQSGIDEVIVCMPDGADVEALRFLAQGIY